VTRFSGSNLRTVEALGRTVAYSVTGRGGEPVVMVHGFGGDHLGWLLVQPQLADVSTTHALDLPGHGASSKDVGPGDPRFFAEIVLAVMDALGLVSAHLVGHSMGGGVCIAAALARPDRVRSLTLLAPATLGSHANVAFVEDFIALDRPEAVRPLLAQVFADPRIISRQVEELVTAYKRKPGVPEALRTIADALFERDGTPKVTYRDRLAGLAMPIRLVWGEADRIVPIAAADGLPPNVVVTRLPGIGHSPHIEAPGAVARAVRSAMGIPSAR
jgi:pyruvate dehydrogenase E2 component (dihydrolipoamide acetyltransferase)